MNITMIFTIASATAGFALAWNLQAHQLTKLTLEHANERIAIARANRATIERTSNAVIQAQNAAAGRVAVLKRDADTVRAAAGGLRDDLDATRRAAATTIDACNRHSATVSELLVEAVGVGRELAQACDGHASDVRTLTEAWPK
jgi:hypothetical protein